MAVSETARIGVQLDALQHMLVFIEDKTFFDHPGVSLRGLARAIASLMGLRPRSGGSTITQQLVRTLFVLDLRKVYRRKIVEILLALRFEKVFSKAEILELYLSSVRYAEGVFGATNAMKFFFGEIVANPSRAQAFFLIERISNIRSILLVRKVDHTLRQAMRSNVLEMRDAAELMELYVRAVRAGQLVASDEDGFNRLHRLWS
jgi:penicillin-binding protein 1A